MLYTQFEDNFAKCKNVRIENNIAEEVLSDIKKLTKAGVINVIYTENKIDLASEIEVLLNRAGYIAKITLLSNDIFVDELQDNCEGIVLLGSSLSKLICGNKCLIVADDLHLFEILHKDYYSVIVDEKNIKNSSAGELAGGYGILMAKLIACFDYKLSCIAYSKNDNLSIISEIEEVITSLFLKTYTFNFDESFSRDLAMTIISVGMLESMLNKIDILSGYDICSLLVKKVSKSNNGKDEFAMLVGWYILNVVKSLIKNESKDLFLPSDIIADLEFVSGKAEISKLQLLNLIDNIVASEYTRLLFISFEYKNEIEKSINKIYTPCQNAIKNFRRIYYDAGLEIAASITMKDLSECVLKSVIFNPQYSFLKMYRILGIA